MTFLVPVFLSAAQPTAGVPLPEGHRPFGPASRDDVLDGWETFIEDARPSANCAHIDQPMVQPLNPPQRERAVALLHRPKVRLLSEREASRLLGVERRKGRPLASTLFERALEEMRQRRHRAQVERRDSWSRAEQEEFDKLIVRFATGDHQRYRPYLVRAVSKFGDGHGGAPFMEGRLCDADLHLSTLVFSYTIPPSVKVPTIVFLPRRSTRVIASVLVGW